MELSALGKAQLTIESGDVSPDGIPNISVVADWS